MLCSNCHQNWWQGHPIFGDYSGSYVILSSGNPAPWDVRLSYTFQGVTPGGSYYVGFWQQDSIPSLASWTVTLGGTVVYNTLPTLTPEYIHSAIVVATSTSLTLVMEATSNVYDYRSIWLNGVTLMQQPTPTGPSGQPSEQPSVQPTKQLTPYPSSPSSQPKMSWGGFVGFDLYNCEPGCDPGTSLTLPHDEVANGWSSDTGGVNMICSTCHQNWWQGHPVFGDYTGNYVFLQPLSGDHGTAAPWDIRLSYTFRGVTPGNSYSVGFWQQNRDPAQMASWTVSLGGTVVYNTLPTSTPEYIHSAIVVATSTSLTLVMEATNNVYDYRSIWLNGVTLMQQSPTGQPTRQPTSQPTKQLRARVPATQVHCLSLFISNP